MRKDPAPVDRERKKGIKPWRPNTTKLIAAITQQMSCLKNARIIVKIQHSAWMTTRYELIIHYKEKIKTSILLRVPQNSE